MKNAPSTGEGGTVLCQCGGWPPYGGFNMDDHDTGDGTYFIVAGDGGYGFMDPNAWIIFYRDEGVWSTDEPAPDAPEYDGIPYSHVYYPIIDPSYREIVATTTFDVRAGIHLSDDDTQTNAVTIAYQKPKTGARSYQTELLENVGWDGTARDFYIDLISSLPEEETWIMEMRLATCDELGNCIARSGGSASQVFSIVSEDPDLGEIADLVIPPFNARTETAEDCEINFLGSFSLSECVGYLLKPNVANVMAQYGSLTLEDRFPFAYAYQVGAMRDTLTHTSATIEPEITIELLGGEITMLSPDTINEIPFVPWVRTFLEWMLWIVLAEGLYRRVLRTHDK